MIACIVQQNNDYYNTKDEESLAVPDDELGKNIVPTTNSSSWTLHLDSNVWFYIVTNRWSIAIAISFST